VKGYDEKDGKDGADPTVRAKYVTQVGQMMSTLKRMVHLVI
jgi:hypothetical protein